MNLLCLLPKPKGGQRTIALLNFSVRLFLRCFRHKTRTWAQRTVGHWDAAIAGSSALRAGILEVLLLEIARHLGRHWYLILWDLAKFYDSITIPLVIYGALERGYPPQYLYFTCINYISIWTLRAGGSLSTWVQPSSSVLAGCGEANNMARVALYSILYKVSTGNPTMVLQSYVDDVKFFDMGESDITLLASGGRSVQQYACLIRKAELQFSDNGT